MMESNVVSTDKPKIKFRNYKPYDNSLLKNHESTVTSTDKNGTAVDNTEATKLSSTIDKLIQSSQQDIIQVELEETKEKVGTHEINIVPKKINWDLKRHAEYKVEKLRKRTQRAIVEILREKLAENGGEVADTDDEDLE